MDELLDHLAEAFAAVDEAVGGFDTAGPDATSRGRTAADLVAHLIDGQRRTAALVRDAPGPQATVVLAGDALDAFRVSCYDVLAALGEPWVLTRTFPVPGGSTSGIVAGRLLLREALAHGRDLAATTGGTLRVRDRIVALALGGRRTPSVLPPGPPGPAVTDSSPLGRVQPGCSRRPGS